MRVNIAVAPDGTIECQVPQGTHEEGKAAIARALRRFAKDGIRFTESLESVEARIEQHRHDDPEWEAQHHHTHDSLFPH